MADNVAITSGTGTTIAADEVTDGTLGSCKVQYIKVMDGTLDSSNKLVVSSTGGASVEQATAARLNATIVGTGAAGTAATGVLTVQGIASMTKLLVTPDLPSGASTAAKQPALGTAGTASADVITIQGIASMTKLLVTPDANAAVNVAQLAGTTTDTNSGNKSAGTLRVVLATDQPALTNKLLVTPDAGSTVTPIAGTSGGCSMSSLVSAATTNATSVKASAGQLYSVVVSNINAAVRYLKLFDKASAPTVGSDTPVLRIAIPGNANGAGSNFSIPVGAVFATGIAYALTTGATDADTGAVAANEILVNLLYK